MVVDTCMCLFQKRERPQPCETHTFQKLFAVLRLTWFSCCSCSYDIIELYQWLKNSFSVQEAMLRLYDYSSKFKTLLLSRVPPKHSVPWSHILVKFPPIHVRLVRSWMFYLLTYILSCLPASSGFPHLYNYITSEPKPKILPARMSAIALHPHIPWKKSIICPFQNCSKILLKIQP